MRSLSLVLAVVSLLPSVLSTAIPGIIPGCVAPQVIEESYIGEHHNVLAQTIECQNTIDPPAQLEKRQANICGATCNTICFTPSGGGPDPNECHVIADALRYASQNTGSTFTMNPANGTAVVAMQYGSCSSFIVDQAGVALTYCRNDWASVIDWVAPNCQATQNAHGGDCLAADGRWFIQYVPFFLTL
ncbi:hypothetical protein C8Q75DRAFT_715193 [Abortiporus biennis]|nr:hypothetical protein C8Q75DRAFT_715193 [Abortiporus biennis]